MFIKSKLCTENLHKIYLAGKTLRTSVLQQTSFPWRNLRDKTMKLHHFVPKENKVREMRFTRHWYISAPLYQS